MLSVASAFNAAALGGDGRPVIAAEDDDRSIRDAQVGHLDVPISARKLSRSSSVS